MDEQQEYELKQKELNKKIRELRLEKYACQSVARKVLPDEKVAMCLRQANGKAIGVHRHFKTNKAFYAGLRVCGRVWICPVCASKISEKRVKELKTAFEAHKDNGGKIAMLTLTFSHKRTDKLEDILKTFGKATEKFMSGKAYQAIREKMGIIGRVRALEVTWSNDNGFHPHTHIAIFYENVVDLDEIEEEMYRLWKLACKKHGLKVNREHGLDLQNAENGEKYLAKQSKWSLEQELTKAHSKKGKKGSLTPFDFLRKYLETEEERYLYLFREYAECFKGKRQLQWSQGLKEQFVIVEKSDEDLAKEKTEDADLLGLLNLADWKMILKQDSRAEFLNLCETKGFDFAFARYCRNNSTIETSVTSESANDVEKLLPFINSLE